MFADRHRSHRHHPPSVASSWPTAGSLRRPRPTVTHETASALVQMPIGCGTTSLSDHGQYQDDRARCLSPSGRRPAALQRSPRFSVELPADLDAAVLVVQHMAEGFVEGLARWLDGVCPLPVVVAVDGERLQPAQVYLAPANQNMVVRPGYRVGLTDPPPGQYHVPGVDVTFRSVAQVSGQYSVAALLTGMGRDGAAGLKVLRDIGAFTIGQDESTSVVWGMPAAAQEADAVDLELPLPAIGQAIVTAVQHAVEGVVEVGS